MRYFLLLFIHLYLLLSSICHAASQPYLVGNGIYDITGPAAEIDMMGYAKISQLDSGIHSRLWSRAFIIADPKTNKSVVFVSADLGMIFNSIKQGVIKALQKKYGDQYTLHNVMISATHTHSGPGGYAHRALFNITTRGFDKNNYDTIVNGITNSIILAHNNLEPGNILINTSELTNTTKNRSTAAYLKNPIEERQNYEFDTDKSVTQIKFTNASNNPVGLINWHAVHGVSMSNNNKLISGDNKGYASYLFEKKMGANYLKDKTFVAAFAQANEGDASPNIFPEVPKGHCQNLNCQDIKHTQEIGKRQFDKALELFNQSNQFIGDGLDYRYTNIDMNNTQITAKFSNNIQNAHTCQAALGYAFAAGTSDGAGADSIFHQGQLKSSPFINLLRNGIASPTKAMESCQAPKPILLAVGLNKPAWVSHNMPIQLFKIGKLIIAGVPGEFTTMAGRRLKSLLKKTYASEAEHVVIAGLANDYAGYVTTKEEYQQQNYEAGFTVFGQWTHAAYLQSFHTLAMDMLSGKESTQKVSPEDMHTHTASFISPVLFDDKLPTVSFGSVHIEPQAHYDKGGLVHTTFWVGHPRNNFETRKSFLEVQQLINNEWQTIAYDWDFNTSYQWQRVGISYAYGHVYWQIPLEAQAGTYRIKHFGHYKYGWDRKIYAYEGTSKTFTVG